MPRRCLNNRRVSIASMFALIAATLMFVLATQFDIHPINDTPQAQVHEIVQADTGGLMADSGHKSVPISHCLSNVGCHAALLPVWEQPPEPGSAQELSETTLNSFASSWTTGLLRPPRRV